MEKRLFVSIPHSGERIPDICEWLTLQKSEVLLTDVDRFVDKLYLPTIEKLQLPYVKTEWHRYAVDLNRSPEDVDLDSYEKAHHPKGQHPHGFHWAKTMKGKTLLPKALSTETHNHLIDMVYTPFHAEMRVLRSQYKYHLDLHSMPSVGGSDHRDPGERRAEVVISDSLGKSANPDFLQLVCMSYLKAGFKVAYNWPYFGGRITEMYGHPQLEQNSIQIELNRGIYMNESSFELLKPQYEHVMKKLDKALSLINEGVTSLK